MSTSNGSRAFEAFFCGLSLGLVGSMLFAPLSGRQTRRLIGAKARDLSDIAGEASDCLTVAAQDVRAQVTGTVTEVRDQLSGAIQDVKSRLEEAVETGKRVYREELRNTSGA
jgi:gas vesicle protein